MYATFQRSILITAAALTMAACSEGGLTNAPSITTRAYPPRSPSFLAAALNHFALSAQGSFRFDPRPLRSDADPFGVLPESVDAADDATQRFRVRVAERIRIRTTDFLLDSRCLWSGGVVIPEDMARVASADQLKRWEKCRAAGQFTTVILGIPQPVASEEAVAHSGKWMLRAQRITTYSFHTWDLYLRPTGADGWEVVEAKEVFGIMS